MLEKTGSIVWSLAALLVIGGCATVNPRHDYDRVGRRVIEATGQERVYRPEDDELVDRLVEGLTQHGISADAAVQISLLNNPTLQSLFMDVGMARADAVQAGLFSNPFVGISARFPDGGGLANLEFSVAQNLAEIWQIPARRLAAERTLDVAILDLSRRAAGLAADAKFAYYRAVGAAQRHQIAQENLAIAQSLLELARARREAGAASQLDVNLSKGIALDAEIDVTRSQLAVAEDRRTLATLLGFVSDADALNLVDPLPADSPEAPDAESFVRLAKAWRLDIRAAEQAVTAAQRNLEYEYSLVFPVVEIGLELERSERRSQGGRNILADTARASMAGGGLTASEIQSRSERRSGKGQDVILGPSLGIELPLFDQNQAQIAKAQYVLQQARKTLDGLDRAVTQEVRSAVDRAMTAWRLMHMYRDRSIPLAQGNLDLSREAYRAGRASFLSVLETQRFFLETRRGYVEASQTAATMIPQLERTIGLPFDRCLAQIRKWKELKQDVDKENDS